MATTERVSKMWKLNPRVNIDTFDPNDINESNLVNQLLKLTQHDVTYSLIMNLFGSFDGKSFCNPYDTFEVPVGGFWYTDASAKEYRNTEPFITTIGIWIFNIFFLQGFGFSYLFGGYINENINDKKFNNINQTLIYALAENKITTYTYKQFLNYTQFFMPFESVLAPNHTEAVLKFSKTIQKKKEELIKANKEALDKGDLVVISKIEKELIEYAKEVLKDDPGLDVYLSGAGGSIENNFKNIYIMKGAVKNPDPSAKQQFNIMESNFFNGVSANEYSLLANTLAEGPYARAKKTEVGGYWEKLFSAALQNIYINGIDTDCGTKKYIEVHLTEKNINEYMYNYIIKDNGDLEELTSDNINKTVKMRFAIFCKSKDGICNKCAGNLFIRRDSKNVGLACMQIPSTLKLRMLKAFHDTTIQTVEIDPMKAFGVDK